MIADNHINALHFFISGFTSQDDSVLDFPPHDYKRQLDNYFDIETQSITLDINRDLEWMSKETNTYLKEGFKREIPKVKSHINSLLEKIENIGIDSTEGIKAKMQVEFCERIQTFIDELLLKIDALDKDALTDSQIENCHFERLRMGITIDYLKQVYLNLKANHWICSRHTSMGDFIYYFTGDGIKPIEPIHWKVSTAKLTLFLDEIVEDEYIWSKASHIFLVKNKPVGKKVLGNTHSKSLDRPITEKHLRELKNKITRTPW